MLLHSTIYDMLSDKMIPDVDVLGSRVLYRIVGDRYGTYVVTQNRYFRQHKTIVS